MCHGGWWAHTLPLGVGDRLPWGQLETVAHIIQAKSTRRRQLRAIRPASSKAACTSVPTHNSGDLGEVGTDLGTGVTSWGHEDALRWLASSPLLTLLGVRVSWSRPGSLELGVSAGQTPHLEVPLGSPGG